MNMGGHAPGETIHSEDFLWISSMSIIGGDVEPVASSVPSSTAGSTPASPRNRVKFLCSHGGKILPRTVDGHLKYVGGETRVISILREITFPELMKKVTGMFDGEMTLRYQLIPEDLDILVTVKSDEDVHHMIEECDGHESLGAPRLRAFLFPTKPIIMAYNLDHHQSLEQRYINSINGILVNPTSPTYNNNNFKPFPGNTSYTTFSISSACSSPRSPPETTTTAASSATGSLIRNHSSPGLCNLGNDQNQIVVAPPNYHHQPPQPHHFHHQQPPPKPPLDRHPNKPAGYYRQQADYNTRSNKGGYMYYYQKGSFYDDYNGYERTHSPPSPGLRSGR